jgi:hypothetical protein
MVRDIYAMAKNLELGRLERDVDRPMLPRDYAHWSLVQLMQSSFGTR